MKAMTIRSPLVLLSLLVGGALLFGSNGFFPVPIETWLAIAGILVFSAGLIFGLVALIRAIAIISTASSRRQSGITIPLITAAIAIVAWLAVIMTAVETKRSMDKRAQYELDHWDELHGTKENGSQQGGPGYPPQGVGSPDP